MNDLRDRLQELADGYAHTSRPPGPAAARRRGRWRRRRTVGGLVLAGLLVIAAGVGLLPALQGLQRPRPVAPPPAPAPVQVPRSTAWSQAAYLPGGLRLVSQSERPAIRSGPFRRVAQSFRLGKGDGQFIVSVHPDLQRLDVARELRTYPTVRVVPVRGRQGWIRVGGETRWPTIGETLMVLPAPAISSSTKGVGAQLRTWWSPRPAANLAPYGRPTSPNMSR